MMYENVEEILNSVRNEFDSKKTKYCVLIPVINEGSRIRKELERAYQYSINTIADIIICDGGSTDGSVNGQRVKKLRVNTVSVKQDVGKQGAQLRMGMW